MKKILFAIGLLLLMVLFTAPMWAQVQGCNFESAVDTTGETDYWQCRGNGEFWFIDVALIDSSDTLTVWLGTNKPDSTYTAEDYTQVNVRDLADWGTDATEITGDEAEHKYMILAGYKFKNIMIKANAISDTTNYTLWNQ